ncbi:aldo/keto reductase [Alloscardovia criceti]|uniref:aldo/keto reductase n=1 Tax=Alloscardovia criceti TaxID=356828 RepID=UPI0003632981|nr:aldo/keto reductase [Alloscardovia criceti]
MTDTTQQRTITLSNGVEMPLVGFGTFQPSASAGEGVNDNDAETAVFEALKAGYRLIDTAAFYQTEAAVGRAVRRAEDELGIQRSDIFITTKLWWTSATYDKAAHAYERSLERAGLDYYDLYLIHNPLNDMYGAWRAMMELYKNGQVRAIGVSNYSRTRLEDFITFNEIAPHVNQIEVNVYHQQDLDVNYMNEHDIRIQAWGPFARAKHDLFHNETLMQIAEKYQKTTAQVVVRWLVQRGITALPKSVNPQRVRDNFDVWDFELTAEDMELIHTLDTGTSQFFDWSDPAAYSRLVKLPFED